MSTSPALPPETRRAILDRVRRRENDAAGLIAVAYRQWWRPFRNARRAGEARRLIALIEADLDRLPPPGKRERERLMRFVSYRD
jgi:hypothetical protein